MTRRGGGADNEYGGRGRRGGAVGVSRSDAGVVCCALDEAEKSTPPTPTLSVRHPIHSHHITCRPPALHQAANSPRLTSRAPSALGGRLLRKPAASDRVNFYPGHMLLQRPWGITAPARPCARLGHCHVVWRTRNRRAAENKRRRARTGPTLISADAAVENATKSPPTSILHNARLLARLKVQRLGCDEVPPDEF